MLTDFVDTQIIYGMQSTRLDYNFLLSECHPFVYHELFLKICAQIDRVEILTIYESIFDFKGSSDVDNSLEYTACVYESHLGWLAQIGVLGNSQDC